MTDYEKELKRMEDLALKCVEAAEGLRKQVERIMGVKDIPEETTDNEVEK